MWTLYGFSPVDGVHDVVERHHDRRVAAEGVGRAEQEVVPDIGEHPDHRDDQDRRRDRQHDAPEDAEEAGAVDLGGFHQLLRHADVEAAGEDGGEGQPVDGVDEDEAEQATGQAELAERRRHRDEDRLIGREGAEEDEAEDQAVGGEAEFGEGEAVERADQRGDDHCRNDDDEGVASRSRGCRRIRRRRRRSTTRRATGRRSAASGSVRMLPAWISGIGLIEVSSITTSGKR